MDTPRRSVLAVLLLAVGYPLGSRLWLGTPAAAWIGNGFLVLTAATGGVLALVAAVRSVGRTRRFTLLAGLGLCSWTVGQLAYATYELVLRSASPFAGPPDLGFGLAALLLLLSVSLMAVDSELGWNRFGWVLDGVLVALPLSIASWVLVLAPIGGTDQGSWSTAALVLSYPSLDLVAVVVALATLQRRGVSPGLGMYVLGLVAFCVGDSVYVALALRDAYDTGMWVDALWGCGALLLGTGCLTHASASGRAPGRSVDDRWRSVPQVFAIAVLVPLGFWTTRSGQHSGLLDAVGAATMVLLVARQSIALSENTRLSARLREQAQRFRHQALHDALTGLPNRAAFFEAVTCELAERGSCAVIIVDFDGFKAVNDTRGHAAGDELLQQAAQRFAEHLDGALVARLGGDEFGVLVRIRAGGRPQDVADRIVEAGSEPWLLSSGAARTAASAGLVLSGAGDDVHTLIRAADLAMYDAKRQGGSRWVRFDPAMHEQASRRERLIDDLDEALATGQVTLVYQPVVSLLTQETVGYEALVRWQHPELGALQPAEFVPVLERAHRVSPLVRFVLGTACQDAASGRLGADPVGVSVNLSPVHLLGGELVADLKDVLARSGLRPGRLTLELTETAVVDDFRTAQRLLRAATALGVRVSLDDFGTGYSSLTYLRELPVSELKIDQSFVRDLHVPVTRDLLGGIVDLAHRLGIEVVAEGIETVEQLRAVERLPADRGQGFLLGRPAPVAALGGPSAALERPAAVG